MLRSLIRLLDPRARRRLVLGIVFTIVSAFAEMVTIGIAIPFIALLVSGRGERPTGHLRWGLERIVDAGLGNVAALLVAAVLGAAVMRLVLAWSTQRIVGAIGHDLATSLWHRMLHQPYASHARRNSSTVLGGMEKVRPAVLNVIQPTMQGFGAGLVALVIGLLLFAIQPLAATIVAVSTAAIYLGTSLLTRKVLRRNALVGAQAVTQRTQLVQEGLGGIRDIILGRLQPVFEARFHRIDIAHQDAQIGNNLITVAPRFLAEAAAIGGVVVVTVIASRTPGGIVAALPLLGALALGGQRLLPLVQQAFTGWSQATGNIQMLIDVLALIDTAREPVAAEAAGPVAWTRLVLDDVSFAHPQSGPTLRHVALDIARGDRIGIVGRTGSGKSTLLDVVMGLLMPTGGAVLVDGRPLRGPLRTAWWDGLAHVPQAVYLADDSIAGNIAFGDPAPIDPARLKVAAHTAGLDEIVAVLPDGFATLIGERGIRLSGGQRQRIGIARALYQAPSLLILDEATNALDVATEDAVLHAIARVDPGMTIVVVAHRASSLAICERIVRIEDGTVTAGGARSAHEGEGGVSVSRSTLSTK